MERSRDAATARETQPGITRPSVIVVNIVEADGGSENSIFLEQFEIDEGTRRGVGVVGDRERMCLTVVVVEWWWWWWWWSAIFLSFPLWGLDIRATPPWDRMSAGKHLRAMTA
ncbi:hypothetical protein ACFX2I_006675 [Malus domestica]